MLNLRNFSMNALLFLMEPWVQPLGNMDWMKVAQEGKGLSQRLKKHCDIIAGISISNEVESLNASVACGISLFVLA